MEFFIKTASIAYWGPICRSPEDALESLKKSEDKFDENADYDLKAKKTFQVLLGTFQVFLGKLNVSLV